MARTISWIGIDNPFPFPRYMMQNASGNYAYSEDAVTWTESTPFPSDFNIFNNKQFAYDEINRRFVRMSQDASDTIATIHESYDGINWALLTTVDFNAVFGVGVIGRLTSNIACLNGRIHLGCGFTGAPTINVVYTDNDGGTWNGVLLGVSTDSAQLQIIDNEIYAMLWTAGGNSKLYTGANITAMTYRSDYIGANLSVIMQLNVNGYQFWNYTGANRYMTSLTILGPWVLDGPTNFSPINGSMNFNLDLVRNDGGTWRCVANMGGPSHWVRSVTPEVASSWVSDYLFPSTIARWAYSPSQDTDVALDTVGTVYRKVGAGAWGVAKVAGINYRSIIATK